MSDDHNYIAIVKETPSGKLLTRRVLEQPDTAEEHKTCLKAKRLEVKQLQEAVIIILA